ncbi:MAG: flavodoxin family protein [Longicatena sp.]
MKTMVFIGSPNKQGNTNKLVNEFLKYLKGDVEIINVFDFLHVKPCVDCGYCHSHYGCVFHDEFDDILNRSFDVDCFVVATPMWFGNVSGPMMAFFSRLQTITSGHIYRKDMVHKFDKAGVFIMASGQKWHNMGKTIETTAEFIFNHFDALILDTVYANGTEKVKACECRYDLEKCKHAANIVNTWFDNKNNGVYYKYGYTSENYIRLDESEKLRR